MDTLQIESYLSSSFNQGGDEIQVEMSPEESAELFDRIQAQWTNYGETEPYASVLSDKKFLLKSLDGNIHILEASGVEVVRRLKLLADRNHTRLPSGKCLELGCGVGRVTVPLAELFSTIIATDISPGNLSICDDRLSRAGVSSVETLLLGAPSQISSIKQIDAFVSVLVLQHNPPPVQYFILDNIFSALQPNGIVFFQTATFNPAYSYRISLHLGLCKEQFEAWSLHCLPMRHIFNLMHKHQIEIIEVIEDGQSGGLHNRFHSHTFFGKKSNS